MPTHPSEFYTLNLIAGWSGFLAGALSGAVIGLFFHKPEWLGGYGSFSRRLCRLGHIAFFGLGLINILFALSIHSPSKSAGYASVLLVVGMLTMPLNCFLSAASEKFRHLFFIPAGSTALGIGLTIISLL